MKFPISDAARHVLSMRGNILKPISPDGGYARVKVDGDKEHVGRMFRYRFDDGLSGATHEALLVMLPYRMNGETFEMSTLYLSNIVKSGDDSGEKWFVTFEEKLASTGSCVVQLSWKKQTRPNAAYPDIPIYWTTVESLFQLIKFAITPLGLKDAFAFATGVGAPRDIGSAFVMRVAEAVNTAPNVDGLSTYDFGPMDREFHDAADMLLHNAALYHVLFAPYLDEDFGNTPVSAIKAAALLTRWYCDYARCDPKRISNVLTMAVDKELDPYNFVDSIGGRIRAAASANGGNWEVLLPVSVNTAKHAMSILLMRVNDIVWAFVINTGYSAPGKPIVASYSKSSMSTGMDAVVVREMVKLLLENPHSNMSALYDLIDTKLSSKNQKREADGTYTKEGFEFTQGFPPSFMPTVPAQEGGSCTWNSLFWGVAGAMCATGAIKHSNGVVELQPRSVAEFVEFCACACARVVVSVAANPSDAAGFAWPCDLRHSLELCTRRAYPGGHRAIRFAEWSQPDGWHAARKAETAAEFFRRMVGGPTRSRETVEALWPAMMLSHDDASASLPTEMPWAQITECIPGTRPRTLCPPDETAENALLRSLDLLSRMLAIRNGLVIDNTQVVYLRMAMCQAAADAATIAMRTKAGAFPNRSKCAKALIALGDLKFRYGVLPLSKHAAGIREMVLSLAYCVDRMYDDELNDPKVFAAGTASDLDTSGSIYSNIFTRVEPTVQCIHTAGPNYSVFPLGSILQHFMNGGYSRFHRVYPMCFDIERLDPTSGELLVDIECPTHPNIFKLDTVKLDATHEEACDCVLGLGVLFGVVYQTVLPVITVPMVFAPQRRPNGPLAMIDIMLPKVPNAGVSGMYPERDLTNHLDVLAMLADDTASTRDVANTCRVLLDRDAADCIIGSHTPCHNPQTTDADYALASAGGTLETRSNMSERSVHELMWQYTAAIDSGCLKRLHTIPNRHVRIMMMLAAYQGNARALSGLQLPEKELGLRDRGAARDGDDAVVPEYDAIARHIACVVREIDSHTADASLHETFGLACDTLDINAASLKSESQQILAALTAGYWSYTRMRIHAGDVLNDKPDEHDWKLVCASETHGPSSAASARAAILTRLRCIFPKRDVSVVQELVEVAGDRLSPYTRVRVGDEDRLFSIPAMGSAARQRVLVERVTPDAGHSTQQLRALANSTVSFGISADARGGEDFTILADRVIGLEGAGIARAGGGVWLVKNHGAERARGGVASIAMQLMGHVDASAVSAYRITNSVSDMYGIHDKHRAYILTCDHSGDAVVVSDSDAGARVFAVASGTTLHGDVLALMKDADRSAFVMHRRWDTAGRGTVTVIDKHARAWIVSLGMTPEGVAELEEHQKPVTGAWAPLKCSRYTADNARSKNEFWDTGSRVVATRVSVSGLSLERTGGEMDLARMHLALDVFDYDAALCMGWNPDQTESKTCPVINWRRRSWDANLRHDNVYGKTHTNLARYSTAMVTPDGYRTMAVYTPYEPGVAGVLPLEVTSRLVAISNWSFRNCVLATCSCGEACDAFKKQFRGCGTVEVSELRTMRTEIAAIRELLTKYALTLDPLICAFDGDGADFHCHHDIRPLLPRCVAETLARSGLATRRWIYSRLLISALTETLHKIDELLETVNDSDTANLLDVLYAIELVDARVINLYAKRSAHVVLAEESSGFIMRHQQNNMLRAISKMSAQQVVQMAMGGGKSSFIIPTLLYEDIAKRPTNGDSNLDESDRPFVAVVVPEQLVTQTERTLATACSCLGGVTMTTLGGRGGAVEAADISERKLRTDIVLLGDKTLQTSLADTLPANATGSIGVKFVAFAQRWKRAYVIADEVDRVTDATTCELNAPVAPDPSKASRVRASVEALAAYVALGRETNTLRPALKAKADACAAVADRMRVGVAYGFGDQVLGADKKATSAENYMLAVPYFRARNPANRSQFNDYELKVVLTRRAYAHLVETDRRARWCDVASIGKIISDRVLPSGKYAEVPKLVEASLRGCPRTFARLVTGFAAGDTAISEAAMGVGYVDLGGDATAEQCRTLAGLLAYVAVVMHAGVPRDQHNVGMCEFFAPSVCRRCSMFSGTVTGIYCPTDDASMLNACAVLAGSAAASTGPPNNIAIAKVQSDGVTDNMVAAVVGGCVCGDKSPALGAPDVIINPMYIGDPDVEDDLIATFLAGPVTSTRYDALIDACGVLWRKPAREYASVLAGVNKRDVFFVAEDGERCVLDWRSKGVTKSSDATQSPNSNHDSPPIIFYDHKSTVGVDFKQPARMRGLVVVDAGTTMTEIAQSTFRLRRLTRGHMFDIVLVPRHADGTPERVSDAAAIQAYMDPASRVSWLDRCEKSAAARALPLARAAVLSAAVRTTGGFIGAEGGGVDPTSVAVGFFRRTWCETSDVDLHRPEDVEHRIRETSGTDAKALNHRSMMREDLFNFAWGILLAARQSTRTSNADKVWQTQTQQQMQTQQQAQQEVTRQTVDNMLRINKLRATFEEIFRGVSPVGFESGVQEAERFRKWVTAHTGGHVTYAGDATLMLDHLFAGMSRNRTVDYPNQPSHPAAHTARMDPASERLFVAVLAAPDGKTTARICTSVDASAFVHACAVDAVRNGPHIRYGLYDAFGRWIFGNGKTTLKFPFEVGSMMHTMACHVCAKRDVTAEAKASGVLDFMQQSAIHAYMPLLEGEEKKMTVGNVDIVHILSEGRSDAVLSGAEDVAM